MIRTLLGVLLLAFVVTASPAQQINPSPLPSTVGQTSPVSPGPVVGATAIGTPVIVSTVNSSDNFNFGNVLASIWNWFWIAFGGIITAALSALLIKWMNKLGVETTAQQNTALDLMIKNALNDAAAKAGVAAQNANLSVEVKNQIVQNAIQYVQAHGPDAIKALGLDPQSGTAVAAIKAKMESVLLDPSKPTNPALQPGLTAGTP